MVWERGVEIAHTAHIGNEVRKQGVGGIVPIAVTAFAVIIVAAVVILLWVSNADFGTEPAQVPITRGPCAPFCTEPAPPAQP